MSAPTDSALPLLRHDPDHRRGGVGRPHARHRHLGPAVRRPVRRLGDRRSHRRCGAAPARHPVRSWQLGSLGLIAWGVAYSLVVVNSVTYRQTVTPERLLGRVNTAGRMLSWGVGWTGGAVLAGGLAAHLGTRPALVLMAAFTVPAVVVAWRSPLRTPTTGPMALAD